MHKALTRLGLVAQNPVTGRNDETLRQGGGGQKKGHSTAGVGVRWLQGAHMDPALRNEKG